MASDEQVPPRSPLFDDLQSAVREPFEGIWREATRLHFRFSLYKQLYGTQERVDLLNEVGIVFFYQLQFIMLDDVVLASARLLDKAPGTLTLYYLLKRVEQTRGWAKVPELMVSLADLQLLAEPLTAHRNKRIAHADIEHHPAMVGSVLPGISVCLMEDFLERLRGLIKDVSFCLEGGAPVNTPTSQQDDGNTLIWNLCKAVDYDALIPDAFERSQRLAGSRHGQIWSRHASTNER